MRILSISGMFAPYLVGGAEYSSYNLAKWLQAQGHEIAVLTTAPTPKDQLSGDDLNGMKTWRFYMPRPYPIHDTGKWWQKPLWHLLDHFAPSNRKSASQALDSFKPDFVLLHIIQGLGHNIIEEIARRDIPTIYFLHDLGLVCIKRSMFKAGKDCEKQCGLCIASSKIQEYYLKQMKRLTIVSPSQANLDKIGQFFPFHKFRHQAALNVNIYPQPSVTRVASKHIRFLYVGRLHATKGINLLLDALEALKPHHDFSLTIIGTGPDLDALRNRCKAAEWVHITGQVSQNEVSNHMVQSDLLCFPSIWAEPLGGVAIHALLLGLPVFGSNKGGIPEVVEHDKNGLLIEAGHVEKWKEALETVLRNPALLDKWREYAVTNSARFKQDALGANMMKIMQDTLNSAQSHHQEQTNAK